MSADRSLFPFFRRTTFDDGGHSLGRWVWRVEWRNRVWFL